MSNENDDGSAAFSSSPNLKVEWTEADKARLEAVIQSRFPDRHRRYSDSANSNAQNQADLSPAMLKAGAYQFMALTSKLAMTTTVEEKVRQIYNVMRKVERGG